MSSARSSAGRAVALAALWLCGPGVAIAQFGDEPTTLYADELEFRGAESVYLARGNVRIEQGGRELRAARVYLNDATRLGAASGSVEISDAGDTLRSEFLQFDVDSLRGVVFDGELVGEGAEYTLTGDEIRKIGDKRYTVDGGRYTTCDCPKQNDRDPWSIRASETDAEIGGYAVAKHARFEVLGVPVVWLPWFAYPLKEKRTTGFLVPNGGRSSRSGFKVETPFFWAARDNLNITARPAYLGKRGFRPAVDTEYVFGERSQGELSGMYIHDNGIDPNEAKEDFSRDRWGLFGEHRQDLPGNLHFQFAGVGTSDNSVTFDFDDFDDYRENRYLFTNAFVWTHQGPANRFAMLGAMRIADDLQNPDVDDRDEFMLQRLPEFQLNAMTGSVPGIPGLVATADLEYVYYQPYVNQEDRFGRSLLVNDRFYDTGNDAIPTGKERNPQGVPGNKIPGLVTPQQKDFNFDDFATTGGPEGDGRFQEGEPLADRGHRLYVQPRLSYPLHLWNAIHLVPEVGYYGTFYDTENFDTEARHLLTGRADLRAQLQGEIPWFWTGRKAEHFMEPYFAYAVVTDTDQDDLPIFVPRTAVPQERLRHLERGNLTLDPADRVGEVSSAFLGLDNRFLNPKSGRPLAEIDVSTEYRFANGDWGPSVVTGAIYPGGGVNLRFHSVYEIKDTRISDGLFQFSWQHANGHGVSLRYRYVRNIPQVFESFRFDNDRFDDFNNAFSRINQVGAQLYLRLNPQWAVTYLGGYSFNNSLSLRNVAGIEYLSRCKCWAFRVEASHDRQQGTQIDFQYRLLGVGDNLTRPFSQSQGNPFARR